MNFLNQGSIRKNLSLLILLAVLPAIVILLYTGIENRNDNIRKTEKEVTLITHTMAEVQQNLALSIEEVLSTLALTSEIQSFDVEASNQIFKDILKRNANYRNVSLINLDGDVIASGLPYEGVNLGDRKQFKDALATRGFVSGEYILARIGNKAPAFPFAYPVLDKSGSPKAVLALAVDLSLFSKLYSMTQLPDKSFVAVTDHRGVRLFYYPPKETNPVGKPIKGQVWELASHSQEPGIINMSGSDGAKRIIAFEPVRLSDDAGPYMYVWAGVPESFVLAPANSILKRNMFLMVLVAVGALLISRSLGRKTLIQPIQDLMDMTGNFSRGHFDNYVKKSDGIVEFRKLTESFCEMAESLSASQEELKKSEERFKTLSEVTFEGVVIHKNETVHDVNDSLLRLFGYTRKEMIGNNLVELLSPPEFDAGLREYMSKSTTPPCEFTAVRKDGEQFPAEIETREFRKGEELFRVSAIRDLTKRKAIEAQNQQMARLADLGEMASGVAHEINNPISGVINCAELLKHRLPSEDDCQGIADRIIHEGVRIANIVKALLTIAHPGSKDEVLNVEENIDTVLTLFEHKLESAGINVSVQAAEELPQIKGDRQKIEQVLLNLVSNSYDALNAKFPEPGPGKNLKISIASSGKAGSKMLCVEIFDQGVGIPEKIIGRIFDPFFTTKPAGSGTGIGLGICYQIVNAHGGVIRVESEEGQYTRFTIELPVVSS